MANLIYQLDETATTWLNTGGDLAMNLKNLAAGTGRQGAVKDFGASARASKFIWRFWCKFATAPVVDEVIGIYKKTGDGTSYDNDDGTGDIAVSAENKLKNLTLLKSVFVDEASTLAVIGASGIITIRERYFIPVVWNDTADNFVNTDSLSGFSLTPVPDQIQ